MDYQFTKINIINELSEEEKAYRQQVVEKYNKDMWLKTNIRLIILCFIVILLTGVWISIYNAGKGLENIPSFIVLIMFLVLCMVLIISEVLEALLNILGLINITCKTKKQIELIKMQMEIEKIFIPFASPDYNPIGFEVTDRTFEIAQGLEDIYISFKYVAKNLVNLDIVEKKLEFKVLEVVKNCSVIVPTLDITNVKLILPSDENGNLLEEQERQSVDTN